MTVALVAALAALCGVLAGALVLVTRTRVRGSGELVARLDELEAELGRLTERETAHDVAWAESKEQISRHLKRVAEIERRANGGAAPNGMSAARGRLLDLKLGKKGD